MLARILGTVIAIFLGLTSVSTVYARGVHDQMYYFPPAAHMAPRVNIGQGIESIEEKLTVCKKMKSIKTVSEIQKNGRIDLRALKSFGQMLAQGECVNVLRGEMMVYRYSSFERPKADASAGMEAEASPRSKRCYAVADVYGLGVYGFAPKPGVPLREISMRSVYYFLNGPC